MSSNRFFSYSAAFFFLLMQCGFVGNLFFEEQEKRDLSLLFGIASSVLSLVCTTSSVVLTINEEEQQKKLEEEREYRHNRRK
ncbi:MAG: hypothetical protein EAZ74_01650 [Alphaproteobacteria bacterium]|nr:MAG: hypothetical protein EAY76_07070 [Alphaproteobacteria bacterium]TAF15498.1 MAG: hypothetical protein EAZ74_01650 [Alphaproteobacteria bacterium]TAF40949.1 MAG: hypothetical protein EAZ66_02090 [Alphaproteobacteria bacterium]